MWSSWFAPDPTQNILLDYSFLVKVDLESDTSIKKFPVLKKKKKSLPAHVSELVQDIEENTFKKSKEKRSMRSSCCFSNLVCLFISLNLFIIFPHILCLEG